MSKNMLPKNKKDRGEYRVGGSLVVLWHIRAPKIFLFRLLHSLAMKIKETLLSRAFSVSDPDPYMLSLKAMEQLSKDAKVVEKKNTYETDGPHHRSEVDFDTIDLVDDFSKIIFHFNLLGEDGLLRAGVNGSLLLNI